MDLNAVWGQSYSNRKIVLVEPDPREIRLDDIAQGLGSRARYAGQTRRFYSVAEHCVLGAALLPPTYRLPFLLHDVGEAYLPDIHGWLKPHVRIGEESWETVENRHAARILLALGEADLTPLLKSQPVLDMDMRMLRAEKDQGFGAAPEPWADHLMPADTMLQFWSPAVAAEEWKRAFFKYAEGCPTETVYIKP